MKKTTVILIMSILGWLSCKQAYNPRPISATGNYLVVEGTINTGTDSTLIHLSHTVPISSRAGNTPELGAIVTIIGDAGASYPCVETGKGYYTAAGLNVPSGNFGLKINTSDGKVYQSDLVQEKNSPQIDSVYYRILTNGVQVYADTHDPANNSHYYRWEFNETYEFHSAFSSHTYLQTVPADTVLPRALANQVYKCWKSDSSTNILLNSSAKLTRDVITQNPITFIPSASEMLERRYSIQVRQYALTTDTYNYYQQLKKNTEQLGSVFDAQPSELPGNIHCLSNPAEPVIGYLTAGSSAQARIFIDNTKLPAWKPVTPYDGCMQTVTLFKRPVGAGFVNDVALYIYTGAYMPIDIIEPPGSSIILGYTASSPLCVDCTLRGTNKRPGFWTDQ